MREGVVVPIKSALPAGVSAVGLLEEFAVGVQAEVYALMPGGHSYEVQLRRAAHLPPPGDWPFFIYLRRRSPLGGGVGNRAFDFNCLDTAVAVSFRDIVHKVFQSDDCWAECLNIDDQVHIRAETADKMSVFICVRFKD